MDSLAHNLGDSNAMAQCHLDSDEGLLADGQSADEEPQHTTQQEAGESGVGFTSMTTCS